MGINAAQAAKAGCDPSGLVSLKGVDYPVASAFLSIVNPKTRPVIDQYALKTVFGPNAPSEFRRAAHYRAFAEHLANEGPKHWPAAPTIHDLDQRAMRVSDPKEPEDVLPTGWTHAAKP
jgi:hypothetical protein